MEEDLQWQEGLQEDGEDEDMEEENSEEIRKLRELMDREPLNADTNIQIGIPFDFADDTNEQQQQQDEENAEDNQIEDEQFADQQQSTIIFLDAQPEEEEQVEEQVPEQFENPTGIQIQLFQGDQQFEEKVEELDEEALLLRKIEKEKKKARKREKRERRERERLEALRLQEAVNGEVIQVQQDEQQQEEQMIEIADQFENPNTMIILPQQQDEKLDDIQIEDVEVVQNNNDFQIQIPNIIDEELVNEEQNLDNEVTIPVATTDAVEEEKKKKEKKERVHFQLLDFYNLRKIKYTMEFDQMRMKKMCRSQFVYTLDLKQEVEQILQEKKEQGHNRLYIDLGLHIKQMKVKEMWILERQDNGKYQKLQEIVIPAETSEYGTMPSLGIQNNQQSYKNWYLSPQMQAQYPNLKFENISKDLNSLDYLQKDLKYYKNDQQSENLGAKPELHIQKFLTLKLKKQDVQDVINLQLQKELKLLVIIGEEPITYFGIKAIDYKQDDTQRSKNGMQTYLITQDTYEASQLWLPQIFGSTKIPVNWSLNYLVPKGVQVISTGSFKNQLDIKEKTLFVYKSKIQKIIPDKIGFIIGDFPYTSEINQNCAARFVSNQILQLFEAGRFYQSQVDSIVESLKRMLKIDHPSSVCGQIRLIFVPNLFPRKNIKQSIDFAGCLHIYDEDILLPRNVIEKRHKIYKILATSLSYDYFGNQIWEESQEDAWLLTALRERIGDRYKKEKCGQSMYRYYIMKIMKNFVKKVRAGAERFSLSSTYVSHFSELQYGEDIFIWKCQLIIHIVEQLLGETHFFNVTRELIKRSNPTVNLDLFKKILKGIGIKFADIQRNWIDSTSCPQIDCQFIYNKKNNSVDISLEQHSAMKQQILLKDNFEQNKHMISQLNPSGKELLSNIENFSKQETFYLNQQFKMDGQRDCRRWFTGDIKVVIYQTDGAEITAQTQKIKLKYPKTKVQCNIPLTCKVRKAIHNKKRDDSMLMDDFEGRGDEQIDSMKKDTNENANIQSSRFGSTAKAEELHRLLNDSQWRFGIADHEFAEYPERFTKSLFEIKNLECPILWLRVDPDLEYIRRVKVQQTKENWLFQLLQEKDHMGQIEACKELRKFNDEFVYEILKAVVKNQRFFFKVRKQALKSLEIIQVSAFSQFLSHEKSFLINYFNSRNFNEKIGFYKSNDFRNILEYYMNTYLLKSLAKSKENKLKIKDEVMQQKIQITNEEMGQERQVFDHREYSITSDLISNLMIRLLRENDNTENAFDDCFFVGKILSNLGKLDNWQNQENCMLLIAQELHRRFNFDHIGKFSTQYAISKGAIKGYYNLRRQIYEFKQFKQDKMDESKTQQQIDQMQKMIAETEKVLDEMHERFEDILRQDRWPLEIRTFLYRGLVKNYFMFTEPAISETKIPSQFLNPLYRLLKSLDQNLNFRVIQLQIIAQFLEQNFLKKCNFKECLFQNDQKCRIIIQILWRFIAQEPYNILDSQISYWTKRIYSAIFFGSNVPLTLQFEQQQLNIVPATYELEENWTKSEAHLQIESEQQELLKQNNALTFQDENAEVGFIPGLVDPTQIQPDFFMQPNPLMIPNQDSNVINIPKILEQAELPQTQVDNPYFISLNMNGLDTQQDVEINQHADYTTSNIIDLNLDVNSNDEYQEEMDYQENQDDEEEYKPIDYEDEWPDADQNVSNKSDLVYEEEIDDFPDYKFDQVWQQKCWDILYMLYFDVDSGAFLMDISEEAMGTDFYYDYVNTISTPINFHMIKQRMINREYQSSHEFAYDMNLVFTNCMDYNVKKSKVYKSAQKMQKRFKQLLNEQKLL